MFYLLIWIPFWLLWAVVFIAIGDKWASDTLFGIGMVPAMLGIALGSPLLAGIFERDGYIVARDTGSLVLMDEDYVTISGENYGFAWRNNATNELDIVNTDWTVELITDLQPEQAPWVETNFVCVSEGFDWFPTGCDEALDSYSWRLHVPTDGVVYK